MKIEMMTGCTANYLGVDGVSEVDMKDDRRLAVWKYITLKMHERTPKSDDLNQLLQFLLHQWGEWEYGDIVCECCGDTVDEAVLEL